MEVEQSLWTAARGWTPAAGSLAEAQLVLAFGSVEAVADGGLFSQIRQRYPRALVTGCSTAGEIHGTRVLDHALVVTALRFRHASVALACAPVADAAGTARAAAALAAELRQRPGLRHVLVFSDGLLPNGSTLAATLRAELPAGVHATGGLAGDGGRFEQTLVFANSPGGSGRIAAVGLYGDGLRVGCGSLGGWNAFGPERRVTRSEGNVLYELDGGSALQLYKSYLGPYAEGLPGSGLRFPLLLEDPAGGDGLVRTVLAVDESRGSMTFAGDLPEGRRVRLMKANVEGLVDGACGAASLAGAMLDGTPVAFALLISCVGRKLVLQQRVEEEVESVHARLGPQAALAGFYSYGELCPHGVLGGCELHNQTMTITSFAET